MANYHELLAKLGNGVLVYGTLSKVANSHDVHLRTDSRIWNRANAIRTYLDAVFGWLVHV